MCIRDSLVINCTELLEISHKVYPPELNLEPSNGKGNYDHFLYLDINVTPNNTLVFKIYNKTDDFNFEIVNFPFPKSNIHSNITYSSYFSQLFRYARICTNYIDFKSRSQILSHKLIVRGFSANKLAWQFKKLSFQYNQLLNKYNKNYQDILNDILR